MISDTIPLGEEVAHYGLCWPAHYGFWIAVTGRYAPVTRLWEGSQRGPPPGAFLLYLTPDSDLGRLTHQEGRSAQGCRECSDVLSVYLMYRRFARAFKIAAREEGFIQIFGAGLLLVIVGTVTYTLSQDWSLVNGFYFAIATLTTSSIADPHLTITSGSIKVFTVLYILIGIGILVELARQIGFAFVEVRREDHTAKQAKKDAKAHADSA